MRLSSKATLVWRGYGSLPSAEQGHQCVPVPITEPFRSVDSVAGRVASGGEGAEWLSTKECRSLAGPAFRNSSLSTEGLNPVALEFTGFALEDVLAGPPRTPGGWGYLNPGESGGRRRRGRASRVQQGASAGV